MGDEKVCIGMFRPLLHEIPRVHGHYVYAAWYSTGGVLLDWNHSGVIEEWQKGRWDRPLYATRDEIIEKMAKLELEKKPSPDPPEA